MKSYGHVPNKDYLTGEFLYPMVKNQQGTIKRRLGTSEKSLGPTVDNTLHHLAFDNSLQANIITTVSSGKIVIANTAACKLLGYSKKELLTKSRAIIIDMNEGRFKKTLKEKIADGKLTALVTVIKKSGKRIPCEITSAVFKDEDGIEKSIITISDISQNIRVQRIIDIKKDKIIADNIV
ncbi:MAG: PAS domain-containing protein, partial [Ginsengibacter sp.]